MLERDIFDLQPEDYSRVEDEIRLIRDPRDYGVVVLGEFEDEYKQDVFAQVAREYASQLEDDTYFYYGLGLGIDLAPHRFKTAKLRQGLVLDVKNRVEGSFIPRPDGSVSMKFLWYVDSVGLELHEWFQNVRGLYQMEKYIPALKGFGLATASIAQNIIEGMGEE